MSESDRESKLSKTSGKNFLSCEVRPFSARLRVRPIIRPERDLFRVVEDYLVPKYENSDFRRSLACSVVRLRLSPSETIVHF